MQLYSVLVFCLVIVTGIAAETDDDTVTVEVPKIVQRRRKVKQIRPHWASQSEGGNFRATTFSDDGSYWNNNNQFPAQNYAAYGGTPPWNYGNQQGGTSGQQGSQQPSGYYPPTGGQGQNLGSQSQYPGTGPTGPHQPQPGYPNPSYPVQPGQTGQGSQPGYPNPSYPVQPGQTGQGSQPGYPQRPQPSQPGYPQRPQPSQPGYPQQPQPGQPSPPSYPQRPQRPGSQTGSYQPPSPPGSEPPLPQRPPSNQIVPGSPFYPQIQPGLPGPPEGELESELKKYCRAPRGQFAIETSCNKYVNCWDDVVVEQECPANLVFSEEKKYCDFVDNVNCGNRPHTSKQTSSSSDGCTSPFATYRSPNNCGEFFVCAHSIPYRFVCPGGLAYNTDLGICDFAYRVDCNGVPILPVEETSQEPDGQGEYENTHNENPNYGSGNNNGNTNYGTNNGNYYGSYGSSGTKPYGRTRVSDHDVVESDKNSE